NKALGSEILEASFLLTLPPAFAESRAKRSGPGAGEARPANRGQGRTQRPRVGRASTRRLLRGVPSPRCLRAPPLRRSRYPAAHENHRRRAAGERALKDAEGELRKLAEHHHGAGFI